MIQQKDGNLINSLKSATVKADEKTELNSLNRRVLAPMRFSYKIGRETKQLNFLIEN